MSLLQIVIISGISLLFVVILFVIIARSSGRRKRNKLDAVLEKYKKESNEIGYNKKILIADDQTIEKEADTSSNQREMEIPLEKEDFKDFGGEENLERLPEKDIEENPFQEVEHKKAEESERETFDNDFGEEDILDEEKLFADELKKIFMSEEYAQTQTKETIYSPDDLIDEVLNRELHNEEKLEDDFSENQLQTKLENIENNQSHLKAEEGVNLTREKRDKEFKSFINEHSYSRKLLDQKLLNRLKTLTLEQRILLLTKAFENFDENK